MCSSARVAERRAGMRAFAAERDQAAAQQKHIRLDYIHCGVDGRNERERDAALQHLLAADPAYVDHEAREESATVLLNEAQLQLDLDLRAFRLDLATLHALGGRAQ